MRGRPAPVLVAAEAGDALAAALMRRLQHPLPCRTPTELAFSFSTGRGGQLLAAQLEADGRLIDADALAGIVFRPGPSWALPRRARSAQQVFAAHETRAAWCAWLAAFPGPVLGRLAPGWFVDRERHQSALGFSLAAALGLRWHAGAAQAAALLVGAELLPADARAESQRWCHWLRRRAGTVQAWRAAAGLGYARLDACALEGGAWRPCNVELVPAAPAGRRAAHWAARLLPLLERA